MRASERASGRRRRQSCERIISVAVSTLARFVCRAPTAAIRCVMSGGGGHGGTDGIGGSGGSSARKILVSCAAHFVATEFRLHTCALARSRAPARARACAKVQRAADDFATNKPISFCRVRMQTNEKPYKIESKMRSASDVKSLRHKL